jgi:hypothetical protein
MSFRRSNQANALVHAPQNSVRNLADAYSAARLKPFKLSLVTAARANTALAATAHYYSSRTPAASASVNLGRTT